MAKQAEIFNWQAGLKQGQCVLSGTVVGHPTIPDYTEVSSTSPVVRVEFVVNRYIVHTRTGSSYKLGVPNIEWIKQHPNGKQDFIDRFLESTK